MNTIEDILKNIMIDQDINQTTFANRIGVKPSQVSEWIRGKCKPSYDIMHQICLQLNISSDYLLGLTDENQNPVYVLNTLPADEERLLQEYRKLDKPIKKMCYYYVEHMVTATKENKEVKNNG